MVQAGFPVWVDGIIKTGPMRIDFSYCDTLEPAGVLLEFESYRLFRIIRRRPPPALYQAIGRFQRLSGWRSFNV